MHNFKVLALAAPFLASNTNAQYFLNDSESACTRIQDEVTYNTSTTRTMQALRLEGSRPAIDESGRLARFSIKNDTSRTWELSLRVTPGPYKAENTTYSHTIFLDTGDSNMTDIGSCHQTIQPEAGDWRRLRFRWTREILERSLDDNGDCTSILSAECINALKKQAADQASQWPLR